MARKPEYEAKATFYLHLEQEDLDALETLATKYTNNNVTKLIQGILRRFIKSESK